MTLPLEGLRMIDMTRALSGPFCSIILADLGADIFPCQTARWTAGTFLTARLLKGERRRYGAVSNAGC